MKFEKKYIKNSIIIITILAILAVIAIIAKASYISTVERQKWQDLGKVQVGDPEILKASRGNIFSADGQLMASSLPNYKVYIDFLSTVAYKDSSYTVVEGDSVVEKKTRVFDQKSLAEHDTLWTHMMDSVCEGMAKIMPIMTAKQYNDHLSRGLKKHSRYYPLTPDWLVNYIQYHEIKKLPMFNKLTGGLIGETRNNRKKPFGSLAQRTLGNMFPTGDSAKSGLERAYHHYLKGQDGSCHKVRVLSKNLPTIDTVAVDGYDLISTLDVSMQDICENALREKLVELDAEAGVVVLMEVQTGDVKAISNLKRDGDSYKELQNFALSALWEPGSTFKTASIMVALDDGYITPYDTVDTGKGRYTMHGSVMKDHNGRGFGKIDVPHTLMYSSNIGVSRLIDKYYFNQPEKFVEGLRRIGIGTPLGMPELFQGAVDPRIRMPKPDKSNWSKTALAWMSIGYETQIPPISTVTFYNAIANGGKLVKPRFVKGIARKGEMVEEFPVEVINPNICKESTLVEIQKMLYRVVNDKEGLGKRAGNPYFHVSGKTGTAQVAEGGGYNGGKTGHLVSFCGYYPSEDPKYTCIVAIRHNHYVASGGSQAGPVFSKIAQRVYSKDVTTDLRRAKDSTAVFVPEIKAGDMAAAQYVLNELNLPTAGANGMRWGRSSIVDGNRMEFQAMACDDKTVPSVIGMGARDAVFALESRGLKVHLRGRGKVTKQSIAAGRKVVRGQTVRIELN